MNTLPLCRCCSFLLLCGSFDECDNPKVSQQPAMTSRLYSTRAQSLEKGSRLWQALSTDHFLKLPQPLGETRSCMLSHQRLYTRIHAYKQRGPIIGQTHVPHDHAKPIVCSRFQVSRYSEVCDRMQPLLLWMKNYKRYRNNKVILQNTKPEHTLTHV